MIINKNKFKKTLIKAKNFHRSLEIRDLRDSHKNERFKRFS